MMNRLKSFCRDRAGSVGVILGLSTLPVVGFAGAGLDYARAFQARIDLQGAADAGAIGAVLAAVPFDDQRFARAREVFGSNALADLSPRVTVTGNSKQVTVTATANVKTTVLSVVQIDDIAISSTSTAAKVFEGDPPCLLALNRNVSGAITVTGNSEFVGAGCVLHSNSSHGSGMILDGTTPPKAAGFCAVGSVSTTHALKPKPRNYCDEMPDPFARVPFPSASGCTYQSVVVSPKQNRTLKPGTYCGGLDIKGTATLEPGIYVIKDGPLVITSQASVAGVGVTFALTGTNAGFTIDGGGSVDLKAPAAGAYGGILVFQDRTANPGFENRLAGGSGSKFTGAIYTPTQKVTVTGNSGFGQTTNFMPVIADQIRVSGTTTTKVDLTTVDLPAPMPRALSGARLLN